MKKIALILLIINSLSASAQEWEAWTPQGIPVNYFDYYGLYYVSGTTLYIQGQLADTINIGLPITGSYKTIPQNNFYITAGDGSYSDGLYFYNSENRETSVVAYLFRPQFLKKFDTTYYIGCMGSLYSSYNLADWNLHMTFDNDELVTHYFENDTNKIICVRKETSINEYIHYIKHSEDNGENWQTDTLPGFIVDCDYDNYYGLLALILADENDETALYESYDNGETVTFTKDFPNASQVKIFDYYLFGLGQSRDTSMACYGVSLYWKNTDRQSFINGNLPTHNILFIDETEMDCFNITIGTDMGAFAICGVPSYLNKFKNTAFRISPNPVNNSLTVDLNQKEIKPVSVTVTSMDGRLIMSEERICPVEENQIQISTGSLPNGFYLISLQTEDKWIGTRKFIKE
jgi:hypothetical protein